MLILPERVSLASGSNETIVGNMTGDSSALVSWSIIFENDGKYNVSVLALGNDSLGVGCSAVNSTDILVGYLPSDLNGDDRVDILDVATAAKAFGSKLGDPRWNVAADVDENGIVNILDISKVAKDYGKAVTGYHSFFFSFEDDLQGWEARGTDLELGNSTIAWSIVQSQERAKDGNNSLKFYLENWNDEGKIWVERRFVVKPNTLYHVDVGYAFASADWGVVNFFRIITGVLPKPPQTSDELVYQGHTGNGHPDSDVGYVWLDKGYNFTVQSDLGGELYVVIGVWGVWETPRTYYLDNLKVAFSQLQSQ